MRSKNFKFLANDLLECKVIKQSGCICVMPSIWYNKRVLVIIKYPNHYDFFYKIVAMTKLRCFVSLASMYLNEVAYIKLLEPLEYQPIYNPIK